MGDPVKMADVRAPIAIVEFDDTRTELATDLFFAAPGGVIGDVGAEQNNTSDGSSYSATASTFGIPGVGRFGAGPSLRVGGLSISMFAENGSLVPQVGLGGVRFIPEAGGVCAGFWCAGASGVSGMPLPVALLTTGLQVAQSAFQLDAEDMEAMPVVVASGLISNVIPVVPILGALGAVDVGVGLGPDKKQIKRLDELLDYKNRIKRLLNMNAAADAARSVAGMLSMPQDPVVEGELMEFYDEVLFKKNGRGLPFSSRIEDNIRKSVDSVLQFSADNKRWLMLGDGQAPPECDIDFFMANVLYLARKLNFQIERAEKNGKAVFKIRRSSPFQMKDPELAVRFIEAMADVYRILSDPKSGLAVHIAKKTENVSAGFLDAAKRFVTTGNRSEASTGLMEAESRRAWHVSWLQTVGLMYEQGFFARRMAHVGWIVKHRANEKNAAALFERLAKVELPSAGILVKNFGQMASSSVLPPKRYEAMSSGIEALRAVFEISHEEFPGEEGDGAMFFDKERSRDYARRREIMDAVYRMAPLLKHFETDGQVKSEDTELMRLMLKESVKRVREIAYRHGAETRRELYAYSSERGGSYSITKWKVFIDRRLKNLINGLGGLDTEELAVLAKREGNGGEKSNEIGKIVSALSGELVAMKLEAGLAQKDAKQFRAGGFKDSQDFFDSEAVDSYGLREIIDIWNNRVVTLYEAVKKWVEKHGAAEDGNVKKLIKKWDAKIAAATIELEKARANYERFNSRRAGAYFLPRILSR